MLLTEEEANTKRCQEGFAAATSISADGVPTMQALHRLHGYYSASFGGAPMNCLGSGCMAWRWHGPQPYEYGTPLPQGSAPADPGWEKDGDPYVAQTQLGMPVRFYQQWRRPLPNNRRGYCGKANIIQHTCAPPEENQ